MLRNVFRFVIGGAAGILVWWFGTPWYGEIICRAAQACLMASSRFAGAHLRVAGRQIEIVGAALPSAQIPFDQLTYNIVIFFGLFATVRGIWKDRNIGRFAGALVFLMLTHILATAVDVVATYANGLGDWSKNHFSGFERDLWTAADYAYRLGGMFAIAFASWYLAVRAGTSSARRR